MVIVSQTASAKNIIERDMGANKGEVPANIAILDSDSSVVAKSTDWYLRILQQSLYLM